MKNRYKLFYIKEYISEFKEDMSESKEYILGLKNIEISESNPQKLIELNSSSATVSQTVKQGPAPKSKSTLRLEQLLNDLASYGLDAFSYEVDRYPSKESGKFYYEYQIKYDEKIVNLSLLLKDANLSHLALSEELILNLGQMIAELRKKLNIPTDASDITVAEVLTHAISDYTGSNYRANILFRGHPVEEKVKKKWI